MSCDFCNKENGATAPIPFSTNHVCRFITPAGTRVIEGEEDTRICGLAMCIFCREKNGTNEAEYDSLCFYHNPACASPSGASSIIDTSPLPTSTRTSNESTLLVPFVPDFIGVQCCIEALEDVANDDGDHHHFPGYRLLTFRSKTRGTSAVTTRNRIRKEWKKVLSDASDRRTSKKKRNLIQSSAAICNPTTKRRRITTPAATITHNKNTDHNSISATTHTSNTTTNDSTFILITATTPPTSHSSQLPQRHRQPIRVLPLQTNTTLQNNQLMHKQKKDKHRAYSFCCSFKGCNNNNSTSNVSLSRIPTPQTKSQPDFNKCRLRDINTYFKKLQHHCHFLKQMGVKDNEYKKGMRICDEHEIETIKKSKKIQRHGKEVKIDFSFDIPKSAGIKRHLEKESKRRDTGVDRSTIRKWNERERMLHEKHDSVAAARIIELEKLVQALTENTTPSKSTRKKGSPLNAAINNHFGILKSPSMKEKKTR